MVFNLIVNGFIMVSVATLFLGFMVLIGHLLIRIFSCDGEEAFRERMAIQEEAQDAYDRTYEDMSKLRSVSEEYRINKAIEAEEAVYKKYQNA